MTATPLVDRLAGVRRTGPGRWVARCPAHKDRRPSLSVREIDDGRVLLHCFAGCDVESVVGAIGMRIEDLFPPRGVPPAGGSRGESRPYSARELLEALSLELQVAWVVLADVAAGRALDDRGRKRASLARARCVALLRELQHAR